jgi:hypothetical protein
MSHSEERFHCHPSVVFTRLNDTEAVLLHLETKRYYSLNETGARLWELLATTELPDALWQKLRMNTKWMPRLHERASRTFWRICAAKVSWNAVEERLRCE